MSRRHHNNAKKHNHETKRTKNNIYRSDNVISLSKRCELVQHFWLRMSFRTEILSRRTKHKEAKQTSSHAINLCICLWFPVDISFLHCHLYVSVCCSLVAQNPFFSFLGTFSFRVVSPNPSSSCTEKMQKIIIIKTVPDDLIIDLVAFGHEYSCILSTMYHPQSCSKRRLLSGIHAAASMIVSFKLHLFLPRCCFNFLQGSTRFCILVHLIRPLVA